MIPDLSVLWVIFFVLLLTVVVDRLLFKPVLASSAARGSDPIGARAGASVGRPRRRPRPRSSSGRPRAARAEIYREMDEMRRAALGRARGDRSRRPARGRSRRSPRPARTSTPRPRRRASGSRPTPSARRRGRRTDPRPQGLLIARSRTEPAHAIDSHVSPCPLDRRVDRWRRAALLARRWLDVPLAAVAAPAHAHARAGTPATHAAPAAQAAATQHEHGRRMARPSMPGLACRRSAKIVELRSSWSACSFYFLRTPLAGYLERAHHARSARTS